jgi:hypothetical protein
LHSGSAICFSGPRAGNIFRQTLRVSFFLMPRSAYPSPAVAQKLAARMLAALENGKIGREFVDSYAKQFDRPEASAHAERRRELEIILEREILLAMTARIAAVLEGQASSRTTRRRDRTPTANPSIILRDLLSSLSKESKWTAGDAMEFQMDLEIYRRLSAASRGIGSRTASALSRKTIGSPFVDRCAILLDPSMIENAGRAAGKLLQQIESLTDRLFAEISQPSNSR